MIPNLPSLSALESNDDDRLEAELRLANLRAQVAAVAPLAEHIERLTRRGDVDRVGQQLIVEMTRLGCRLLDAAATLSEAPTSEDSGVFARPE
jgi:hypothetical protein